MNNVLNQSYSSGFLSDLYYVNVEQNNYIDTGTEDFTTSLKLKKSGREIIHYSDYILVPVEDYWLPIRFDDRERSIQEAYKGKLVGIDSNVLAEIKNRAAKQNVRGFDPNKVLGKAIEPAKFNLLTRIDFWVGLFILIMSLIGILIVLRRYLSFYRSPVFTGLEMFGEVPILHQLIDFEVERELKIANKIIITKSWLLSERFLTVDIAPLSFCVSVSTKKRIKLLPFTIIPIYRYTELTISLRNKEKYVASLISPWKVQDVLTVLIEQAPWIIVGDAKTVKKLYEQDSH